MDKHKTIVDILKSHYHSSDKGITHIYADDKEFFVSYRSLYQKALCLLHTFQKVGIKPHEELIIQIDDNETFLYAFWACLIGGIIPVPVTVGNNDEHRLKLIKIWNTLNRPYMFTDEKNFLHFEKYALENNKTDALNNIKANTILFTEDFGDQQGIPYTPKLEDIAFLQFSSGSTGDPKGVVLTHENLITNLMGIEYSAQFSQKDVFLSWMPLTHDMGLIGFHLVPLYLNINQYIMPTALFIRRPTIWLKKASEHKTTILSSPNFGYGYLLTRFSPEVATEWDLSSVRLIFNGAEPISIELCEKFLECMKDYKLKREAMYTVYGLAEASLAVAFPVPGDELSSIFVDRYSVNIGQKVIEVESDDSNALEFAIEGRPIKYCSVRICDEDGNPLEDLTVGYIHISGKNVTRGYYNNENATRNLITEDGWVNTGDLGFMKDGKLIVTGRAKEIIFVGGQNYYPHDIERLTLDIEGVELGKVACCGVYSKGKNMEEIVVFVLFKKKVEEFVDIAIKIKSIISKQLGLQVRDVVPVRDILKTTSGKIQRYKMGEKYKNGEYDSVLEALNSMIDQASLSKNKENDEELPATGVCSELAKIFRKVMNNNNISINDNFFDYGGNSIILNQAYDEIDRLYPGKVTLPNIFAYPTIAELAKFIESSDEVTLGHLLLPIEYFNSVKVEKSTAFYQFKIKDNLLRTLKSISDKENVDIFYVFLAMYIFMLAEISNNQKVCLQASIDSEVEVQLNLDLSGIDDFSALIKLVVNEYSRSKKDNSYLLKDIGKARLNRNQSSVVPIFIRSSDTGLSNLGLHNVFDIIMEMREEADLIDFTCEFNSNRLNKDKIKDLVNNYVGLIETITENYGI